ncbi:hypothetical protein N1851_017774 [Merluccius polli]|uniref:Uncharacterized protein n=1 Tax=Merluccius polli TaxID=89951 RepID=A0AA47MPL9_MERPO|nr:hypothetical protein N1851_017774 [Merluccius polli]
MSATSIILVLFIVYVRDYFSDVLFIKHNDVSPELSSLLVLLAAHPDVLPAPWIPAGLYGVLSPDVGPVFGPSRWYFLNTLVAQGTVSSVLWRHVLQHVTTHTQWSLPSPLHQCVEEDITIHFMLSRERRVIVNNGLCFMTNIILL